jgi:hypothetical protein
MSFPRRVSRKLRRSVALVVARRRVDEEMALVEAAYLVELGRPIDPSGEASWRGRIATREVVGADAVDQLRMSAEYLLGRTGFYPALHEARMAWVATLAPFDTILDIGGSSPSCPDGALIELGYPHRPREIHILDRPEDDQFHGRPSYDQSHDRVNEWGTVSYHHGRAEDITRIDALRDRTFACVFMGQTIEHIEVSRLPEILGYIRDHLAPGGRLILDTPNRDLTRLVVGDGVLTHDHTHEYTPEELAGVLVEHGFRVVRALGIAPMPQSATTWTFDPHEIQAGDAMADDPTESFVFALECTLT